MKISSNRCQGAITIFLGWRQVNSWFPEKDQFWGYMWCPWWGSVDSCQQSADLTYIAQGVQVDGTSNMASGWLRSLRVIKSVRIITFSAYFWKNCFKAANTTCLFRLSLTGWHLSIYGMTDENSWRSKMRLTYRGSGKYFAWELKEIGFSLAVSNSFLSKIGWTSCQIMVRSIWQGVAESTVKFQESATVWGSQTRMSSLLRKPPGMLLRENDY